MFPVPDALPEVSRLSPWVAVAQWFDPTVKADLYASALGTEAGLCLVDPFAASDDFLEEFCRRETVAAVVITNENHHRASAACAAKLRAPLFAHADAGVPGARAAGELPEVIAGLDVLEIPGAPAGEIALWFPLDGGTVVVGDALIHFGSHGFDLLPAKYCRNAKLMRRSLQRLLGWDWSQLLFAHGVPIREKARAKLAGLLAGAA